MHRVADRHSCQVAAISMVAVFIASACGSTVQSSELVRNDASGSPGGVDRPGTDGLELPSNGSTDGRDLTSRTQQSISGQTNTDAVPSRRSRNGNVGQRSSASSGSSAQSPSSGRGFTKNKVLIGYATAKGAEDAVKSAGGKGFTLGDQEGIAEAVVRDINANGGIGSRQVELVFYDMSNDKFVNQSGRSQAAQEACSRWTEDQPVFAVVNVLTSFHDETLVSCLASQQTPLVHVNVVLRPASMYARYSPSMYSGHSASMERFASGLVRRLLANKYFHGGWDSDPNTPGVEQTRVGVLSRRDVYGAEFQKLVSNELHRAGTSASATYEWDGNLSTVSNSMNEAVLKFRREGITHVITQFNTLGLFAIAADSQRYTPRYGINSDNTPNFIQENVPKSQLRGALGIGYRPRSDVDKANDPGVISKAQKRCRQTLNAAGHDQFSSVGWDACDGFSLLATGVERGGLSVEGLRNGVGRIQSIDAAATFGLGFPNGRVDGGAAVRDLLYRVNCECFTYLSNKNYGL